MMQVKQISTFFTSFIKEFTSITKTSLTTARDMKCAATDRDEQNWQLFWFYNRLSANEILFNKRGNVHINVTLRGFRETNVGVENQCVTYSVCVFVALDYLKLVWHPVAAGFVICVHSTLQG